MNRFLVALLLLLPAALRADCTFDDFPTMSGMTLSPMLGDTSWNNRPMMVMGFTTDSGWQSVVSHYRRVWRDKYVDSSYAIWNQVTHLNDDCMMTVQVAPADAPASGSMGRLVISNPPKVRAGAELGDGVPMPAGSIVVSDMTSRDGKKTGRITIITVGESVDDTLRFYRTEMSRKGWKSEREFREGEASVLSFRRRVDELNVLLMPAGEHTQVLINEVSW